MKPLPIRKALGIYLAVTGSSISREGGRRPRGEIERQRERGRRGEREREREREREKNRGIQMEREGGTET